MKLYQDYKREFRNNRQDLCFYIGLACVVGFLLIIPMVFCYGQTVEELNNKINQKNSDINKLEQEIKQYQIELNDLGKQKISLNGTIKQLDLTRKKLIADISVTQNKIDKTNFKIQELGFQINNKQESISNNTEAIVVGIRQINELDLNPIIGILFSKNNFTETWNEIDNIISIRDKIREKILELKQIKSDLEDTRKETTDARNELVSLKSKLADQKKIVDQNTIEKKKLLTQTKNSESSYQKLLKDRLAKKDIFEKELNDFESQLKFILDPSKLPGKGVLSWPLDYVYITSPFGQRTIGGVTRFHSGVDFRASVGTPVKALSDGVVAGTGDTDAQCSGVSFGRFILIKYNNGLASTFGHLSLIKVRNGDKVVRGQIVGYSGNTGYSTGPHLHVSIYPRDAVEVKNLPSKSCPGHNLIQPIAATNAYLNPSYYFPSN